MLLLPLMLLMLLIGPFFSLPASIESITTPLLVKDQTVLGINQPGVSLNAPITVAAHATLTFQNTTVLNFAQHPPLLEAPSSTLVLDNAIIILTGDVHIPHGTIIIKGACRIAGPHTWQHSAPALFSIARKSVLTFASSATFSFSGTPMIKEPIYFEDRRSTLHLHNAQLRSGAEGLLLCHGTFLVEGLCTVYAENNATGKGIQLGSGKRVRDNMRFNFADGDSSLQVGAPHFDEKYKKPFLLTGLSIASAAVILCGSAVVVHFLKKRQNPDLER